MIKLQDILTEADTFKAKSKESGRTVVYKSKEAMEKAIEVGKAEPLDSKKAKPGEKEKVKGADLFKSKETDKRTTDEPGKEASKSKYGAKQKGIGAGEKNLKGPQSDAGAIGGSAKAEQKVLKQLRAIGPKDNVDLCSVTVPGTNMFCAGNKGIPRAEMPQLKSTVVPGGKVDKLVKAGKLDADPKTGEVNTEGMFKDMLEKEGISMSEPTPEKVSKLKATQNQLEGSKVNMFAKVLAGEQPFPDKKLPEEALKKWQDALREPIIVSKEGYILDGHHRWAALVQHDVANGGGGDIEMDVKRVDMEAKALVDKTNKFTNAMGLAVKTKKPKKENFESQLLSKINEISIKINEQNPALVEPDGTIKGGPKKDDEEIKEAGFKNLSPFEHKLRLVLKGEEKQKDFPIKVLQTIQLVKVLGRGKLKSSEEKIYKQILKKYKLKEGKLNEFEGRPMPMDTPNEFAYLEYKKWAYKHRGQYKKDMLKHVRKSDGQADSSKMFMTASSWWYKWAYHNNKAYTHIKDKLKFGRALMVMMVKDDLIFSKKAWKKNNKITNIK